MHPMKLWRALAATVVTVGALAALAAIPTAALASPHACGSKTITYTIKPAEGTTEPSRTYKIKITQISTSNVGCETAYKFLKTLYDGGSTKPYKCVLGHFKVSSGHVPESCNRKGASIKFAGQGG
ncbi:MAG TPA: hypothetical protein VH025_04205 [Solirubrobacteraceae bacterium]|jgi:hypothetical protein|nr:hypothetical protein [Solirubrobacteraceae bacterium]